MKIKVCGMKYSENIQSLCTLNIDFIGFIFYKKSLRNVIEKPNLNIPKNIHKVGVFVNEDLSTIKSIIKTFGLDYVQLHGDETTEYCRALKLAGLGVIKAFSIDKDFNFSSIEKYKEASDYFLFDTKGKKRGGNGYTFEWQILKEYTLKHPFILSGGLSLANIEKIKLFKHEQLTGLDLNSKFELKPGMKDINKIKTFITQLNSQYANL